jgi:predicted RNA-binding protein with PIN domain
MPSLPPGVFDGTPEADRHVISDRANLLVVDGYNVARATWSGLDPAEERRRVVGLLEDVRARSKGSAIVVFDGASGTVAPAHSRSVRVQFSETGETADDRISSILASLSPDQPVVVVSSDRAVMADAAKQGAAVLRSPAFVAAAGR